MSQRIEAHAESDETAQEAISFDSISLLEQFPLASTPKAAMQLPKDFGGISDGVISFSDPYKDTNLDNYSKDRNLTSLESPKDDKVAWSLGDLFKQPERDACTSDEIKAAGRSPRAWENFAKQAGVYSSNGELFISPIQGTGGDYGDIFPFPKCDPVDSDKENAAYHFNKAYLDSTRFHVPGVGYAGTSSGEIINARYRLSAEERGFLWNKHTEVDLDLVSGDKPFSL